MILLCKRVRLEAFLSICTGSQILEGPWRAPESPWRAPESPWRAPESLWKAPESLWKAPETPWKAPESLWRAPESPWKVPESNSRKTNRFSNHMNSLCETLRLEAFLANCTGSQILEGPWRAPESPWRAPESPWRVPESPERAGNTHGVERSFEALLPFPSNPAPFALEG